MFPGTETENMKKKKQPPQKIEQEGWTVITNTHHL